MYICFLATANGRSGQGCRAGALASAMAGKHIESFGFTSVTVIFDTTIQGVAVNCCRT
ncbi:MAG: hypothetical protein U0Y96_11715 [Candidatus Kapaibacterium sp.]